MPCAADGDPRPSIIWKKVNSRRYCNKLNNDYNDDDKDDDDDDDDD